MYQNNETALTEAPTQPENKVAIYMIAESDMIIYMMSSPDVYDLHTLTKHESDADAIMFKMQNPEAKIYEHTSGMTIRIHHDNPIQFVQEWIKKTLNYRRAYYTRSSGYKHYNLISALWGKKEMFDNEHYWANDDYVSIYQRVDEYGAVDSFIETKNLDLAVLMCKEFDGKVAMDNESRITWC